ncbi:hypothetical protein [Tenacibaculum mesophilum]|uniref:hypothetical protein n=1 Tax=Tenacibaculum mesophilum TaxID=104268 RepID=UPI0024905651|nr:hypothetical protein [Tenacibaculum mesophilum]
MKLPFEEGKVYPPEPNKKMIGNLFVAEKTSDVYQEVEFKYIDVNYTWYGLLPKSLRKQGLDLTDEEYEESIEKNYKILHPKNKNSWIEESDKNWNKKSKASQTYLVLKALYSGEWECRVCGPVPKVNPQPAARIATLKVKGYIIGSKRRNCGNCAKKTMHDILIMLPRVKSKFEDGNELRSPISDKLKERIKVLLGKKEICFNIKRSSVELIIDHKFPSQRWNTKESANPDTMSEENIKKKFQLLSNQTNMWKSRFCDRCVKEGKRGEFMGIKWYYAGNENWEKEFADESGCHGCPWYDIEKWKNELAKRLDN